jgi:translation initiation factor IF-3
MSRHSLFSAVAVGAGGWFRCRRLRINNRDYRGFDRNRDFGPRMNDRIRVPEIRVVDENNEQLGIMAPRDALQIARDRGLDLIEVAPGAQPPVCRIMDYGKYKYEQGKREREAAKKQRQSEMKGMTLRPGTDDHDLDIKIKNIVKFLADGDKVKVTIRFRSREMSHPEFAQAAMNKIVDAVQAAAVGVVERAPLMEGRQMIMILAPQREGAPKKPAAPPKPAGERPTAPKPENGASAAPATATPASPPVTPAPEAAPVAPPAPTPAPVAGEATA